jgi:hypothetical protein
MRVALAVVAFEIFRHEHDCKSPTLCVPQRMGHPPPLRGVPGDFASLLRWKGSATRPQALLNLALNPISATFAAARALLCH